MSERAKSIIEPVLAAQHQLITPAQAVEEGLHRANVQRLCRDGFLEPAEPRVYRRVGSDPSWHQRILAVLLSLGPPATASHRAVARLLGAPSYEAASPEISVRSKRNFRHAGVIVHESRDIEYVPPVYIDGIPCTPPRRLAVDIGAVLGTTAYTTVLRHLRRDHGVSWKQLVAVLRLHSEHGRDGCGHLRRQVERYYGVEGIPDTTLEQDALDVFIDAWLPLPVCQHVVPLPGGGHFRLDFAYVETKLAIEVDGPHHQLPEVQAADARRDARLERLGWKVLRFPEQVVAYAPWVVVGAILEELRERGLPTRRVTQPLPDGFRVTSGRARF